MTKPVILTGLRANNDLHIGNYFGALLPLIDMAKNHADEYEINLFVPDLHSFTTPIDHSTLQANIMRNLKLFVAAGLPLDNDNIHIYRQSYIPAHSELTWILDYFTGFGEMSRMTQFKDKSAELRSGAESEEAIYQTLLENAADKGYEVIREPILPNGMRPDFAVKMPDGSMQIIEVKRATNEGATVGLFNYPVLMAADMLLYDAKYVPVGDDQTQHLEFTRNIAERFNNKFGDIFVVPEPVKKQHEFFNQGGAGNEGNHQGLRIKSLIDPAKKMSKSTRNEKGVIFLGDDPALAAKKVKSATTDSLELIDPDNQDQPGISNLMQILSLTTGEPLDQVKSRYKGQTQYGPLKTEVADAISNFLVQFQKRFAEVDEAKLMNKLEADEKLMNKKANQTLLRAQKAVGLR